MDEERAKQEAERRAKILHTVEKAAKVMGTDKNILKLMDRLNRAVR